MNNAGAWRDPTRKELKDASSDLDAMSIAVEKKYKVTSKWESDMQLLGTPATYVGETFTAIASIVLSAVAVPQAATGGGKKVNLGVQKSPSNTNGSELKSTGIGP